MNDEKRLLSDFFLWVDETLNHNILLKLFDIIPYNKFTFWIWEHTSYRFCTWICDHWEYTE